MKIELEDRFLVRVDTVEVGDVFRFEEFHFVRINSNSKKHDYICLDNWTLSVFAENELVQVIPCKLVRDDEN